MAKKEQSSLKYHTHHPFALHQLSKELLGEARAAFMLQKDGGFFSLFPSTKRALYNSPPARLDMSCQQWDQEGDGEEQLGSIVFGVYGERKKESSTSQLA